jgi:peroxiredoxin
MPYITTDDQTQIHYVDCGEGKPVVLIHGWPLSHRMWEYQIQTLTDAGYRVVAYDRRGFGESDRPWTGYDYDTLAADLHSLMEILDLEDATLVGFSMGGGEVARYLGTHGSKRVAKAVLVSAVTPFMLKTDDNPNGVPQEVFDEMMESVEDDRIAFLSDFGEDFVNWDDDEEEPVSVDLLGYLHTIGSFASPRATRECITAFATTDFRDDLKKFDVPTLVIHGDADEIVPLEVGGEAAVELIPDAELEVLEDAPHGLNLTHSEELDDLLLDFLES